MHKEDVVIATLTRGYHLEQKLLEELYNDILAVTIFTCSDDNLKLNRRLLEYIKSMQGVYGDLIKSEAIRSDFYRTIVDSILFFKNFLTVRATGALLEL